MTLQPMDMDPVIPSSKRMCTESDLSSNTMKDTDGTTTVVKKHSLDSDEDEFAESSTKTYDVMDEDAIEGEEDNTIVRDGDIKITPFNMKEEMQEGHFDSEGNYFWKKEVDVRDAWLDNIDEIQHGEKDSEDSDSGTSEQEAAGQMSSIDKVKLQQEMLKLMKPRESVVKALRRLGGSRGASSASSRWKRKRAGAAGGAAEASTAAVADTQQLERLTGLADQLLAAGHMEVYQLTYEALTYQMEKTRRPVEERLKAAADDDEALDMFGESYDESAAKETTSATRTVGFAADLTGQKGADSPEQNGSGNNGAESAGSAGKNAALSAGSAGQNDADSAGSAGKNGTDSAGSAGHDSLDPLSEEVRWQFRWSAEDSAEIHGPHTSAEMLAWSQSDYFNEDVQVCKLGSDQFYSVRRIDFELYT